MQSDILICGKRIWTGVQPKCQPYEDVRCSVIFSVVKQKVKEGMTEEYVALVKSFGIEGIRGARRREFIEIDDERTVTDPASSTIIHREAANG